MSERIGVVTSFPDGAIGLPADADGDRLVLNRKVKGVRTPGATVRVTLDDNGKPVTSEEIEEQLQSFALPTYQPVQPNNEQFFNPYTFVPQRSPAGRTDGQPPFHDNFATDTYSGALEVVITATSPLLIMDQAGASWTDKHATLSTLRGRDGAPFIPGSSIKGMLRSAFEIVTGSRMGVFDGKDRLLYRDLVSDGLHKKPALVIADAQSPTRLALQVVTKIDDTQLPAVMVPQDLLSGCRDRDQVRVEAELVKHTRGFTTWRACKVADASGKVLGASPASRGRYRSLGMPKFATFEGVLHITGHTASNKHDERLVVTKCVAGGVNVKTRKIALTKEMIDSWNQTIVSYRALRKSGMELPDGVAAGPFSDKRPGESDEEWNRRWNQDLDDWALEEGRTLFVELNGDDVVMLSPSMVGRRIMPKTPRELVDENFRPASSLEELSPADRVFGWVNEQAGDDDDTVGYRGNLRIEPAFLHTEAAQGSDDGKRVNRTVVKPAGAADKGLTLPPLSSPKPQQIRFYFGDDKQKPLLDTTEKRRLGVAAKRIRGAKVYPHQIDFAVTSLKGHEQSEQNRTIKNYIDVGAQFRTTIFFSNLSQFELGALLLLLSLPETHHHKLGMGKPLGFGSVHLALNAERQSIIMDDAARRDRYSLARPTFAADEDPDGDVAATSAPSLDAQVSTFLEVTAAMNQVPSSREVWQRLGAGLDGPVHYPTRPDGEGYTWFVENEGGRPKVGTKPARVAGRHALPHPPTSDAVGGSLPVDPTRPKPEGGASGGGQRRR